MEAVYKQDFGRLDHTPSSALDVGEVISLDDGRAAVAASDIAASVQGAGYTRGVFDFASASATTFSLGDPVWWDISDNLAVTAPTEAADLYLGLCVKAKVATETVVRTELGARPTWGNGVIQSRVVEVDCGAAQAAPQNLVPAAWNPNGLILLGAYGIVTEQFAGDTEDQGIITVEDSDGTDLCTLTPSDAGADALNDVVVGTLDLFSATTGDAAKLVGAGKGVQALLSQAASGTGAAGKMKVVALFVPLAS